MHAEQGGEHLTLQAARIPLLNDGGEAPKAVRTARHGDLFPAVPFGPEHISQARLAQL